MKYLIAAALLALSASYAFALSPEKEAQLRALADDKLNEQFGEVRPPNYKGYRGDTRGPMEVKAGCVQYRNHDAATRRTWVIVDCTGSDWRPHPLVGDPPVDPPAPYPNGGGY
jgi:hypothetical protein